MNDTDAATVIDLARRYERLSSTAKKVIGDWRASQRMAGQTIHSTDCPDDCEACEPCPPAVQWASLASLEDEVQS